MAESFVWIPDLNVKMDSMPANFGLPLPTYSMIMVSANLQIIPDSPRLCNETGFVFDSEAVVVPDDGRNVALLVERGDCLFQEKADIASLWSPPVRYIIVYNNVSSGELIPMTGEEDTDLALVFISQKDGLYLRQLVLDIMEESNGSAPGLFIKLDGELPETSKFIPMFLMFLFFCLFFPGFQYFVNRSGLADDRPLYPENFYMLPVVNLGRNPRLSKEQVNELEDQEFHHTEASTEFVAAADASETGEDDDQAAIQAGIVCSICLDAYEEGETLKVLPCSHRYHYECLVPWLTERHACCPLCKYDMRRHFYEADRQKRNNRTQSRDIESGDAETTRENPTIWTRFQGLFHVPRDASPRSEDGEAASNVAEQPLDRLEHSGIDPPSTEVPEETSEPTDANTDANLSSIDGNPRLTATASDGEKPKKYHAKSSMKHPEDATEDETMDEYSFSATDEENGRSSDDSLVPPSESSDRDFTTGDTEE
eukprot:Nitzschia sp. Nitz4//scaffold36_size144017//46050//47584//NITZ4_003079-RA/size144017-processed-gene-0.38-mRNA-1//1//CDS//3329549435//9442//frame0